MNNNEKNITNMTETANKTTKTDLYKIDPRNIEVSENFNARLDFGDIQELAGQIAKDGLINPIHVQKIKGTDKFSLIDGERRYRAVMYNIEQGLPVTMIPAIVVPQATTTRDLIRTQIQANEGKNFSEYEQALAYDKLRKDGMSNAEIAEFLGLRDKSRVSWILAHLKRDERVQELMKDGRITGVNVRHIYQANLHGVDKKDEAAVAAATEKAVETIVALAEIADKDGEKELTLKNLSRISEHVEEKKQTSKKKTVLSDSDFNKTKVAMDTTAIKNGLNLLKGYLDKVEPEHRKGLSLPMIREGLAAGKLIDEVLGLTPAKKAE